MPAKKIKIIVIVGPTASGKSELAIKIAKKIKGEIISADSRQIYKGLDIGTGKVAGRWSKNSFVYKKIRHHCLDFVSPRKIFTAAEFKKCAELAIQDIVSRGKTPILTGGTGFWIDAVIYNLQLPAVPPTPKLRQKLEKKSTAELFEILKKLDPERARTIEQKNRRRLIRALEIVKTLGRVPKLQKKKSPYDVLWLGLNPPPQILRRNIEKRAKKMISKGLVKETEKLLRQGISKKRLREFGFEYKTALAYLEQSRTVTKEKSQDKKALEKELYERLVKDTLAYARRQMTWFKRNQNIRWFQSVNLTGICQSD